MRRSRPEGPTAERERHPVAYQPRPADAPRAVMGGQLSGVRVEKFNIVRSEEYRRLVAQMPCIHCGIFGYSQAAHPNTGKGGSLKTDDRLCFPLCTVHPVAGGFVQGCHERFDQGALFTKQARRELEPAWGAQTRQAIRHAGLWPKPLPHWIEHAHQPRDLG